MKAVSRFGKILLVGALAIAPAISHAQEAPSASDAGAVGPKDLQNFSLNGTVTRPADQTTPAAPAPQKRQPRTVAQARPAAPPQTRVATDESATNALPGPVTTVPSRVRDETADSAPPPPRKRASDSLRPSLPAPSDTVALPKLDSANTSTSVAIPASSPGFAPDPAPAGPLGPERKVPLLPWLLAALALGVGGGFLFWRNRNRAAFAGGPQIDAFTAPVPVPVPEPRRPSAPPAEKAPPRAMGIVSTRLRPWIEIGFTPHRCVLENERFTVDFTVELFNSGSAPARAVLVEASLLNAGPAQDRDIGNFFANPVGEGERIVVVPPLKRISVKTKVVVPRSQMQAYELAGHQVYVPLIVFNALYRWSGGEGQTSVSYLLGRDTKGEKMGPFRLDVGPRIFRDTAGRLLPAGVRA